jgi:energy-coupling factor transport system ATP-binding protein
VSYQVGSPAARLGDANREPFVQIRNLTFGYSEEDPKPVLNDISLDVDEGEFLAIEGPTGSGKTTLCLTLNGIVPHATPGLFQGDVVVAGRNTKNASVPDLALDVGVVYQDAESQLFGLTVEEDVAFGLENLGVPRTEMQDRMAWVLDAVDLAGLEKKAPNALSGGQKQRLAIASVLAMRPRVMVLDEPTAELDPVGKQEILRIVRRLCEDFSLTVILVEHESEFIAEFADRVALLVDGRIVTDAAPRPFYSFLAGRPDYLVRVPQVSELGVNLWRSVEPNLAVTLTDASIQGVPVSLDEAEEWVGAALAREPDGGGSVRSPNRPRHGAGLRAADALVGTEDVFLTYPDGSEALRGVSMTIAEGEYVALIGQNGSGKTTLARLLNGLLRPSAGRVLLSGVATAPRSVAELSRTIGYVFQNPDHQLFTESVEKELRYGLVNHAIPETEHDDRVATALRLCGIEHLRNEHPLFTSRGERQLIAIASVIAMEPRIIVFDEPTTGLDHRYYGLIVDLLDGLHVAGHTIVVISHDMRLVAEHAPRTVVLHRGRILIDAATSAVFDQVDVLRTTQISPPQITQLSHRLAPAGISTALSVAELVDQLFRRFGNDGDAYRTALGLPVGSPYFATGT